MSVEPTYTADEFIGVVARIGSDNGTPRDSWTPLNLAEMPDKPPIVPDLGGTGLIYPGKRHVFSGPPESAKTLAAYAVLIQTVRAGETGILIDFEMGAYDARQRLRELGATDDEIGRILYLEPDEKATPDRIATLVDHKPAIIVIDAAAGAFSLEGLDDNRRLEVEAFTNLYVGIFWRNGIATILIDHVVKDAEQRGRYAIGSERKLGGADVHFGFTTVKPIARGSAGHYKLIVHKDRGGYHKRGHLADLRLDSDPETHAIAWAFTDPDTVDESGDTRRTWYMEHVSRDLEQLGPAASRNELAKRVGRTRKYVLQAIATLIDEGFVIDSGELVSGVPFREDEDLRTGSDDGSEPATGSAVRQWFGSGSRTGAASGGSSGSPPYGAEPPPEPPERDHEPAGWFDPDGALFETYLDTIAPDQSDDLFADR